MHDVIYSDCELKVKPRHTLVYETNYVVTGPVVVKDLSISGIIDDSECIQSNGPVILKLRNDGLDTVTIKKGTPLAGVSTAKEVCINCES